MLDIIYENTMISNTMSIKIPFSPKEIHSNPKKKQKNGFGSNRPCVSAFFKQAMKMSNPGQINQMKYRLQSLDNSEFMRNGDYTPSRLEAQSDAATLLFNMKTQSNPENTVALMTMAGKTYSYFFNASDYSQKKLKNLGERPSVLVTLTSDFGKIISALHQVKIAGQANLSTGVQIAQVLILFGRLPFRQNKTHVRDQISSC
jgi:hypothetical protein